MLTEIEQQKFNQLIKILIENPLEPLTANFEEELSIVLGSLIRNYIEHEEIKSYKQLCDFLNIFLNHFLDGKDLGNKNIFNEMREMFGKYPALSYFQKKLVEVCFELEQKTSAISSEFIKAFEPLYKAGKLPSYLNIYQFFNFKFVHPIRPSPGNPIYQSFDADVVAKFQQLDRNHVKAEMTRYAYKEVVKEFSKNIVDNTLLEKFLKAAEQMERRAALKLGLMSLYRGAFNSIKFISHLCYTNLLEPTMIHEKTRLEDIFPNKLFRPLVKNYFKTLIERGYERNLFAIFYAYLFVQESNEFRGWTPILKTEGKDPGFIMLSPDKRLKAYCKSTKNPYSEVFCAKILNRFGIKMAETQLIRDEMGNVLILTWDVSRKYSKNNVEKQKTFLPMMKTLPDRLAYGMENHENINPAIQQENIDKFIKDFSDNQKLRISYAKLLMTGLVFGLSDLGGHGGNIGPITSLKQDVVFKKFGIVDFQFNPVEHNEYPFHNVSELREFLKKMGLVPIFKSLADNLLDEDLMMAAEELNAPNHYHYEASNLLLVDKTKGQIKAHHALDLAYQDMLAELEHSKVHIPDEEIAEIIKKVSHEKTICEKNLMKFLEQVLSFKPAPKFKL